MALHSMTGYGHGRAAARGLRADVELSAVNKKHLEARLAVPRDFAALEGRLLERVQQAVSRGRINGTLRIHCGRAALRGAVQVDEALASAYVAALRHAGRALDLDEQLKLDLLLQLPDVIRFTLPEETAGAAAEAAGRAMDRALTALNRMRRAEGRALEQDLRLRLGRLEAAAAVLAARAPDVAARHRRLLLARLREARIDTGDADGRLLREIALFAERSDISEETARLRSHLGQARRFLRSREPAGRSLDFLAQEMMREINTVGAKANDAALQRTVIDFKAELERFREQVQNIE